MPMQTADLFLLEGLVGRGGTVCPFLPASVERGRLWLASEAAPGSGQGRSS